jgi:hypothetical protein
VGSLTLSAVGFSLYHLTSIWKHCEYEKDVPSICRPSMTGSYVMVLGTDCKFSDCKYPAELPAGQVDATINALAYSDQY